MPILRLGFKFFLACLNVARGDLKLIGGDRVRVLHVRRRRQLRRWKGLGNWLLFLRSAGRRKEAQDFPGRQHGRDSLHAGPRASKDPNVYKFVIETLDRVFRF